MKPKPITNAHARQVEAMAAYGIPEKEIARVIGVDQAEPRQLYPDELDTGATKANSHVAENLYRKAVGEGRERVSRMRRRRYLLAGACSLAAGCYQGPDGRPSETSGIVTITAGADDGDGDGDGDEGGGR